MPTVFLDLPRPLRFLELSVDTPSVSSRNLNTYSFGGPFDLDASLNLTVDLGSSASTRDSVAWRAVPDYVLEPTLDIAWPTSFTGHQVSGDDDADLPINITGGTSPEVPEGRYNGGPWSLIDDWSWSAAGVGSGTLRNQSAGGGGANAQGTLEVRYPGAAYIASVANIIIGYGFITAGQSNVAGAFLQQAFAYFNALLKAGLWKGAEPEDGWHELADHTNGSNNPDKGSLWPLVTTELLAYTNYPVFFVTTAVGGTGIVSAAGDANATAWAVGNYAYLDCIEKIQASRITGATAMYWWQGEDESGAGIIGGPDPNTYIDAWRATIAGIQAAVGFEFPVVIFQTANRYGNLDEEKITRMHAVRDAIAGLCDSGDAYGPVVTCDQDHSENVVHLTLTAHALALTPRTFHFTKPAFGDPAPRGPRFLSATQIDVRNMEVVLTVANGGSGLTLGASPTVGWGVYDAAGLQEPKVVSAAQIVAFTADTATVRLTVTQNFVAPVNLNWGRANEASGATTVDSVGLPPEPFYDRVVP